MRLTNRLWKQAPTSLARLRGGRVHPVFDLWPVRLREDLRRAMVDDEIRKVDLWTGGYRLVTVPFADMPVDPFFNANRPEDFEDAASLLKRICD
jgi:molybdopterin-guanine dinucleotide biosynthesis protein A